MYVDIVISNAFNLNIFFINDAGINVLTGTPFKLYILHYKNFEVKRIKI